MKRLLLFFILSAMAMPVFGQKQLSYRNTWNHATHGWPNAFATSPDGTELYVTLQLARTTLILNVSDPDNLIEVYFDSVSTIGWSQMYALNWMTNDYVTGCYGFGNMFGTIDVTTSSNPTASDSLISPTYCDAMYSGVVTSDEDYFIGCAQDDDMITVFDISDPSNFSRLTSMSNANLDVVASPAIRSDDNYIYVAVHGADAIAAVDVSNKSSISYTSRIVDSDTYDGMAGLAVLPGDTVLVGVGSDDDCFFVVDISDSSSLSAITKITSTDTMDYVNKGALSPNGLRYACHTRYTDILTIIDVSDQENPAIVDTFLTSPWNTESRSLYWVNDSLIVVGTDAGSVDLLFVDYGYDVGTPGAPPETVDTEAVTAISRTQIAKLGYGYYETVYKGTSDYGYLNTHSVNAAGVITAVDNWTFTTGTISYPDIVKIPWSEYVVISYDSSSTPTIALTKIDTTDGSITKSFSDYEKPGGTTASLVIEYIGENRVAAIWPEDTHGSDAYKTVIYEVDTGAGTLSVVDTEWLTGQGRTTDFGTIRRVGTTDYYVSFQPSASNYPKAITHKVTDGVFVEVGIDSLTLSPAVPTNFRQPVSAIDINGNYGFVWVGNDNLNFIRGYAFTVDSTDGTINPKDSFGGLNIDINNVYTLTALGDSTFISYGVAGGLIGAYYTFDFNLGVENFAADPEIVDDNTGVNGDRWDIVNHSYVSETKTHMLLQSYYDGGLRTITIHGDSAPPLLTGDGAVNEYEGDGAGGGIGGFSKWNTLGVSLWNQKTLSKLNGI